MQSFKVFSNQNSNNQNNCNNNDSKLLVLINEFHSNLSKALSYGISNLSYLDQKTSSVINDLLNEFYAVSIQNKYFGNSKPIYESLLQYVINHKIIHKTHESIVISLHKQLLDLIAQNGISQKDLNEKLRIEYASDIGAAAKKEALVKFSKLFPNKSHQELTREQRMQFNAALADAALKYGTADCGALCGIAAAFLKVNFNGEISIKLAGPTYYIHYLLILNDELVWDVWSQLVFSNTINDAKDNLDKIRNKIKPHSDVKHPEVILGNKQVYGKGVPPIEKINAIDSMNDIKLTQDSIDKIVSLTAKSIYQSIAVCPKDREEMDFIRQNYLKK